MRNHDVDRHLTACLTKRPPPDQEKHRDHHIHDPQFYAQLEALEYAMSDKYPYYLVARFFQLIGRKPMGE